MSEAPIDPSAKTASPDVDPAGQTEAPGEVVDSVIRRLASAPAITPTPSEIGDDFVLGEELGRGGMGRVVLARDQKLERTVAVKQLLVANGRLVERFAREVLITARLQHPAIVPIYQAGTLATGEPFYAMKRVDGRTLEAVVAQLVTVSERLSLLPNLIAVVEAIAYAHEQRIIHRDLKPANVLIGRFGETVVIDWGLAKDLAATEVITDETGDHDSFATQAGQVIGSLLYMAPEQARGEPVDERADVFGLGAVLYHALVGHSPFEQARLAWEAAQPASDRCISDLIERIRDTRPPALSVVDPEVPAELAELVGRALSPEPGQRPSAGELARSLREFETARLLAPLKEEAARRRAEADAQAAKLEAERLRAEQERSATRRQRNRIVLAIVAGFLIVGAMGIGIAARQIAKERDDVVARSNELILANARTQLAIDPTAVVAGLKRLRRPSSDAVRAASALAADAVARGVASVFDGHLGGVNQLVWSPDGRYLASASPASELCLREVTSGASRWLRPPDAAGALLITGLVFSPDGQWLTGASSGGDLIAWNTSTGQPRVLAKIGGAVAAAAFSPDGRTLFYASADRPGLGSVVLATGATRAITTEYVWALEVAGDHVVALTAAVASVGHIGSSPLTLKVWHWPELGLELERPAGASAARILLSPSGRRIIVAAKLVLADRIESILLHGASDGSARVEAIAEAIRPGDPTLSIRSSALTLSPDESRLAIAGEVTRWPEQGKSGMMSMPTTTREVRIFGLATRTWRAATPVACLPPSLSYSADGKSLAIVCDEDVLWADSETLDARPLRGHAGPVLTAQPSPRRPIVASGGADHTVRLWAIDDSSETFFPDATPLAVAFTPDRSRLVWAGRGAGGSAAAAGAWRLAGGGPAIAAVVGAECATPGGRELLAISPDGRYAACASALLVGYGSGGVHAWDIATGAPVLAKTWPAPIGAIAFRGNGELVVVSMDRSAATVSVLPLSGGVASSLSERGEFDEVVVAENGEVVVLRAHASPSLTPTTKLSWWRRGDASSTIVEAPFYVDRMAVSSNGQWLAVVGRGLAGRIVRRYDLSRPAGAPASIESPREHGLVPTGAAVTDRGDRLVTIEDDRSVRVWRFDTGAEKRYAVNADRRPADRIALSPDGTQALTGSVWETSARLWNLDSGDWRELRRDERHGYVSALAFSRDGSRVAVARDGRSCLVMPNDVAADPAALATRLGRLSNAVLDDAGRPRGPTSSGP